MKSGGAVEVVPGVWRVSEKGYAAYIVKLSPGAALIDVGAAPSAAGVMMGLQAARVGLSSVRAILLTSSSHGAVTGLPVLQRRSGAPVFSPSPPAALHEAGADVAVRPVRDGDVLARYFRVVADWSAAPGEASGRAAYFFEPARALFTGELPGKPPSLDVSLLLSARAS